MTTSGITAWSLTAEQICNAAAEELGVIEADGELTSAELARCLLRLNAMLKSWQGKVNLFREATGTVTVTGTVGSGTLPAEVRDINDVRYVNANGSERPLARWNRGEYLSLPNKAQAGTPTIYYHSQGVGVDTLFIWPIPADDCDLRVDYGRVAETVTNSSQTLDIPEEWQECVVLGLAKRISNMFGSVQLAPDTVRKVIGQADELERQLLDSDRPDAYILEPDY